MARRPLPASHQTLPGSHIQVPARSASTLFPHRRPQDRKPSPLQRGGTLQGAAAAGKDASDKFKSMATGGKTGGPVLQMVDGRFEDYRWKGGRWDLSLFA